MRFPARPSKKAEKSRPSLPTTDGTSPRARLERRPARHILSGAYPPRSRCPPPGGFTHWVVFNLPPGSTGLPQSVPHEKLLDGTLQGKNDSGTSGYVGPAPPPGKPHHYHFMLYALDRMLKLSPGAGRREVQEAMKGHILAETEMVALYGR